MFVLHGSAGYTCRVQVERWNDLGSNKSLLMYLHAHSGYDKNYCKGKTKALNTLLSPGLAEIASHAAAESDC